MVSYAHVQERIFYGYGKAAQKIGEDFNQYRAPNGIVPISPANLIQPLKMSANISWDYMKANKYGNSIWQLIIDGSQVEPGDFLINGNREFFVTAKQPLLPINGVECNARVSLVRPTKALVPGENPYGGYEVGDEEMLLQDCPVSYIETGRPESNPLKLPLDTRVPRFHVYMPLKIGRAHV